MGGSAGISAAPTRLPLPAVSALADLVAAGYGVATALEALPRQSLPARTVRRLELEVAGLRNGGPLDAALHRLGLEITAATIRGAAPRAEDLAVALRADADAQGATAKALQKTRRGVGFFAFLIAMMALSVLFVSLIVVPSMLEELAANLPEGWELPRAIVEFEAFRNVWLAVAGGFLLVCVALVFTYAGLLGKHGWVPFLQELRLYLPFLRGHAIRSSSARLLEALAHEQAAGIPANDTVRRIQQLEAVPRLRQDLELATARLEAGDPWATCLRGTLMETPELADLASLAGRGARPREGWLWAAARHRELSVRGLRRGILALAALILVPSVLYLVLLLHAASTTAMIAQVENVRQQIELLTEDIDKIVKGELAEPPKRDDE